MIAYPDHEQKNNKDQLVPMTPEAVHFFRKFSKAKRTGLVFPLMERGGPLQAPTERQGSSRILGSGR